MTKDIFKEKCVHTIFIAVLVLCSHKTAKLFVSKLKSNTAGLELVNFPQSVMKLKCFVNFLV